MIPRTYDPIFEELRGDIPIEYLRALAMAESGMNPRSVNPSSNARGLFQIVAVVLDDYNHVNHTSITPDDLLDPRTNTVIAVWHLRNALKLLARENGLDAAWENPLFLGLLTAAYNAGHVGLSKLLARYFIDDLGDVVEAAQRAGKPWARWLSMPSRLAYWRKVVSLYVEDAGAAPTGGTIRTVLAVGGLSAAMLALYVWQDRRPIRVPKRAAR